LHLSIENAFALAEFPAWKLQAWEAVEVPTATPIESSEPNPK